MEIEHRKYARCRVPGDMFYLFSKESAINGWVKDISKGGIAFEFISFEEIQLESKIELILASDKIPFYLPDIACKIIYVTPKNNGGQPFGENRIRRCGVQYEKLNARMNEKLTILLCKDFKLAS
ncbi:MAG: PilZ domain-containing protein [Pseudomonadota bacterium]